MNLIRRSLYHCEAAGFGYGWTGYCRHSAHAWKRTGQLLVIVWCGSVHAIIPGWYPFTASRAVIQMGRDLEGRT